jgi:hypothetical protein
MIDANHSLSYSVCCRNDGLFGLFGVKAKLGDKAFNFKDTIPGGSAR